MSFKNRLADGLFLASAFVAGVGANNPTDYPLGAEAQKAAYETSAGLALLAALLKFFN